MKKYTTLNEKNICIELVPKADVEKVLRFYASKKNWKWQRLVNGGETNNILDDGGVKAERYLKKLQPPKKQNPPKKKGTR